MLHGVPGGEDLEPAAGEKAATLDLVPHDDGQSEEDIWPYMTTKEKRRLWLRRRQMGEFYFRSEFKGLVHAVRSFFLLCINYLDLASSRWYRGRAPCRDVDAITCVVRSPSANACLIQACPAMYRRQHHI